MDPGRRLGQLVRASQHPSPRAGPPLDVGEGDVPMIAELASCLAGGHSSAGADRSLSLLAWIHSTPRQEGFQGRSSAAWSPATMRHAQGFLTLITRAGSAVTGRSIAGRLRAIVSSCRPPLMLAENHTVCLVVVNLSEDSRTRHRWPMCRPVAVRDLLVPPGP